MGVGGERWIETQTSLGLPSYFGWENPARCLLNIFFFVMGHRKIQKYTFCSEMHMLMYNRDSEFFKITSLLCMCVIQNV